MAHVVRLPKLTGTCDEGCGVTVKLVVCCGALQHLALVRVWSVQDELELVGGRVSIDVEELLAAGQHLDRRPPDDAGSTAAVHDLVGVSLGGQL